jgi:hypothetical protein
MDHAEVVPDLAAPADLPGLIVTFATAFSDDAMIRWPMPEATPGMLQELFRVILVPYVEFGVLWKIGGCDGGAAWLPPGVGSAVLAWVFVRGAGDESRARPITVPFLIRVPDSNSRIGALAILSGEGQDTQFRRGKENGQTVLSN